MPTIISGSGSAIFNTPLPASQGGTGFSTFPWFTGVAEFTTVGTTNWTCPAGVNSVEVLLVGGGGAGGTALGGGGGGGGVVYMPAVQLTPGTVYPIVGGGG